MIAGRLLRRSALVIAAIAPGPLVAQGYTARLDFQGQGAAFRGVVVDSVLASRTVAAADGSLRTADGFAVRCPGVNSYCIYYRPGLAQRGGPVSATGNITAWGVGVPGLSLHGTARVLGDVGSADVWPGTQPQFQLLEGYAEYATGPLTARGGRVQSLSRLGAVGYDGATVTARNLRWGVEATGYGGIGLAQASAIPINDPVLNPLDQYQPARRQWVVGGAAGWTLPFATARILYQLQVDRRSKYRISERTGVDLALRPGIRGLSITGGADYDVAEALWGSAETNLRLARGPVAVSVGGRRYRPQFDLWTIWGAFSPTPYHAWNAMVRVSPRRDFSLSARTERYQFEPTNAETALVDVVANGWRWSLNADASLHRDVDLSASYRRETGFGAASSSWDATVVYRAGEHASFSVTGAAMDRPLELRFDDAQVWMIGARASAQPLSRISVSLGAGRYQENRERPDAAALDWNQTRLDVRVTLLFSSGADMLRLPPANGGSK